MKNFDISGDQIDLVVAAFYARVRKDPQLGPVFAAAVGTSREHWRHHEAKIASFWRNAVGLDRSYSGSPMMVHVENMDIEPRHFAHWLTLFRQTAIEVLPPATADGLANLADKIGRSLSFGIQQYRQRADSPPLF